MNARLRLFLVFALLLPMPAYAQQPPADLLQRINGFRLASKDVMAMVNVVQIGLADGQTKGSHEYKVFLNTDNDSVIEMLSTNERGRRVLMTEDAVWLRIPTSDRPIHITPLQRLLGQANYGDVGRLSWDGAYRIKEVSEDTSLQRPDIDAALGASGDQFRPLTGQPLQHLVLEAISNTATYPRIELWASPKDHAPIRADYFLTSGKRLKTGWFSEPITTPHGMTARSVVFHDELDPANVTVMTTLSVKDKTLPKSFFTVRGFTTAVGE